MTLQRLRLGASEKYYIERCKGCVLSLLCSINISEIIYSSEISSSCYQANWYTTLPTLPIIPSVFCHVLGLFLFKPSLFCWLTIIKRSTGCPSLTCLRHTNWTKALAINVSAVLCMTNTISDTSLVQKWNEVMEKEGILRPKCRYILLWGRLIKKED